jgi:tetratricopeptide (TPR) repeat protein
MNENLEYIDDYFQKQLEEHQRQEFEARCLSDHAFAEEVAMYVSTRQALRETLIDDKKKEWAALVPADILTKEIPPDAELRNDAGSAGLPQTSSNLDGPSIIREISPSSASDRSTAGPISSESRRVSQAGGTVRKMQSRKWLALAAAACIAAAIFVYPVFQQDSARDLVHSYVQNELVLSNTMDASRDSLQTGITAYKNKDYKTAITIFKSLYASDPGDQQVLKYLGQSYLVDRDYENALKTFDTLSARPGLRSNPGPFLKGITLMERNHAGDAKQAKALFEKIVTEDLEGKKQAEQWLKKMND